MKDQLRTSLNGGELVRSTFMVPIFARALAFAASFILVFVFAFLSPFRSIFAFCFATVKKECLKPVLNHLPSDLWPDLCLCP